MRGTKLDILAIAVHPDDVELCCAGTLIMEKEQGKKTGIVDLTRGELGTRGTPELRLEEAAHAASIMGVEVRENLGMADGFFEDNEANRLKLIQVIRKYRPEIIIANTLEDRHPDHGRAGRMISTAAFLSGLRKIETTDENGPQKAWRPKYVLHSIQDRYIKPDFVYDITSAEERKLDAIRAYSSQFYSEAYQSEEPQTYISTPAFMEFVTGRDRMFGKMVGVDFAEGFTSEKMLGIRTLDALIQNET